MTRRDDELVRRYHEASELEDARPGAQVRDAVRAHAQMLATAAARLPTPAAPMPNVPSRTAANQPRWKISALAVVFQGMELRHLLMQLISQDGSSSTSEKSHVVARRVRE